MHNAGNHIIGGHLWWPSFYSIMFTTSLPYPHFSSQVPTKTNWSGTSVSLVINAVQVVYRFVLRVGVFLTVRSRKNATGLIRLYSGLIAKILLSVLLQLCTFNLLHLIDTSMANYLLNIIIIFLDRVYFRLLV